MALVRPEERSAAGGITGVARTAGAAMSRYSRVDRDSLLHRGEAQDRLRPDSLSAVRVGSASGGGSFIVGLGLVVKD